MMKAIIDRSLTPKEVKERIHQYQIASQPFIKIMSDFMAVQIPKMIILLNGKLEIQYTNEYYTLKKQIDEALNLLQKEIFSQCNDPDLLGSKSSFYHW